MKNMEMNTVISWGLVVMGNLSICGWIAISIMTGTNNGTEIPLSIASGLVGVLTGKKLAESKMGGTTPPTALQEAVVRTSENIKKASVLADTAIELIQKKKEAARDGKEHSDGKSGNQGNQS